MAVFKGDGHVDLHADGEGDIVFVEEIHPFGADELTVGEQAADGGGGKQAEITAHQRDAVAGVGVALMRQQGEQQRHPEATGDDGQHQDVDVARSELPVGAIERQIFGPLQVEHMHHEPRRHGLVEPGELEEPL
ncbi:MAG: hypothetical protein JF620_02425 [Mesorhizobium sp.]|nr:hypothetical protein [Mesorhizobium sp.]